MTTIDVETAAQLQWALDDAAKDADAIVMTAAVADYRPAQRGEGEAQARRARREDGDRARREPGPARGARQAARAASAPLLVGFAAETEDVDRERAQEARAEAVRSDRRERRQRAGRRASRSTPTTSARRRDDGRPTCRRHRRPRSRTASSTASSSCSATSGHRRATGGAREAATPVKPAKAANGKPLGPPRAERAAD